MLQDRNRRSGDGDNQGLGMPPMNRLVFLQHSRTFRALRSGSLGTARFCAKLLPVLASLCVIGSPSAALEPAIDEIQVTASRKAMQADDVSSAVTLVSGDAVNSVVSTDLLGNQQGTFLQETTPGQGAVIIRGLKGSELLHLVDGIRINNAIFRNAPTQYAAFIDSRDIERVEIVRGAAASLYGSGAMGGVVNFLMQRPSFESDTFETNGDFDVAINSADLLQQASAGIRSGDARLGVLSRLSWSRTGNRRTGSGERVPQSGFDSRAARFALTFNPKEDRHWYVDVQAYKQPGTNRVDELMPGFGETEPGSSEFAFEPNSRYFGHVEHRADNGLFALDWDIDLAWQRIVDDRRTRNYESDERRYERNRSDLFVLDINASHDVSGVSWLYGVEYLHDTVRSRRETEDINTGVRTEALARFPDDSNVDQIAGYARAQIAPGDRQLMFAGLRYNAARIDTPAVGQVPAARLDFDDLSGDIGWTFHVSDAVTIVANAGRGFRAPNIFDLGTLGNRPGNRFNIPSTGLDAEHVTQVDIGFRGAGDRYTYSAFVFSLDYTDRIESIATGNVTPDGRIVTRSENLASADMRGIELSGSAELNSSLSLAALINIVRGTSRVEGESETPADRIPPANGRIRLVYTGTRWRNELGVIFAAEQDRLSPRDVRDPRIDPDGTPGWVTTNLRFSYEHPANWRLDFGFDNLFDKRYRAHGSGIDARGRNLFVSARYQW
jgi:outer membrane receptor protein involved in Fe transport